MQGPDDERSGASRVETAFAAVASGDCDLDAAIKRFDLDAEESALLRDLIEVDGSGRSVTPVGVLLEAVSEFEPPEIPGYSIYEPLGAGGMGVVHRAIQISTGQTVAIKVIGRQGTSAEWRARFQREIAILGRLRHPGIVQILDAGSTAAGDPYFVMQFVEEGMRIDQWCERQGLDADARIALFKEVLAAVGYLHHAGVLHRDLKPSNILVDKQGRPRIIDFGISVPESGGEFAATVVAGTPAYMSPESSASRLGVAADTRADIYSLGLVLASMFGIRVAGESRERLELVQCAIPNPKSQRTDAFRAILARAIEPDPERRYQSTEVFARDLDRLLTWHPVEAAREGLARRLVLSARRSPGLVAVAVLILVILVLVPMLSIDAARKANLEAERANRFSNWLEGTLFELIREEAVREEVGAATRWVDMQALIDPGAPGSSEEGLLAAEQLRVLGEARVFANQGDVGIRMMRDAFDTLERELGESHPRVRNSLGQLIRAVALVGSRAELERLVDKARRGRPPAVFARSDEFRSLFSPTIGEDDLAAELNSNLEYLLDAMAPVPPADLREVEFAARIAEIDALAAVGLSDQSRAASDAWIDRLLKEGRFGVAYRALIRVLALEKDLSGVLERFRLLDSSRWTGTETGGERFDLLALAVFLEEEYADRVSGVFEFERSQGDVVTGSIDRIVRELVLEVWAGDVGESGSDSHLKALLAIFWISDVLEDGMHSEDAAALDLECWRTLADVLGSYPPEEAAEDVAALATRTRDAGEFDEIVSRWQAALDYIGTRILVADDRVDYDDRTDGTMFQELGVDYEEYRHLASIGQWCSRFMVRIQDLTDATTEDRIIANYNLGLERDWLQDGDCVVSYRRAYKIAVENVGENALIDDAAVVCGLVTLDAALRYDGDISAVADVYFELIKNAEYLTPFLEAFDPNVESGEAPTR